MNEKNQDSKSMIRIIMLIVTSLLIGFGLLTMIAWHVDYKELIFLHEDLTPMPYNAALALFIFGMGFLGHLYHSKRLAIGCSSFVCLLSFLTLLQYWTHIDFGIDQLIMKYDAPTESSFPGRMGLNTVCNFIAAGVALLIVYFPKLHFRYWVQGLLGSVVFALGTIAFLGYSSGIETAYCWGDSTCMSLQGAFAFLFIGIGIVSLSWEKEKRYLPVILTACLGTVLSLQVFYTFSDTRDKEFQTRFNLQAQERISSFETELYSGLDEVKALRAFYDGSKEVERSEFHEVAQVLLEGYEESQILMWVPRVPYWQKDAYESKGRGEGVHNFHFYQVNSRGESVDVQERNEYYPIFYVEYESSNKHLLGFDIASNVPLFAALNRARDIGRAVTLGPMDPMKSSAKDQRGIFVFNAVYAKEKRQSTLDWRRRNLLGFVGGVFEIKSIMQAALRNLDPAGIHMFVYDLSAPKGRRFLLQHRSRLTNLSEKDRNINPPDETTLDSIERLHYREIIDIEGRQWLILCLPTEDYLAREGAWVSWIILAAGLLFTFLIVAYLFNVIRSGAKLENLNFQLENEIYERKRMEELHKGRSQVLEQLAAGSNLREVLQLLIETLQRVRPEMLGSLLMLDKDKKHLHLVASVGLPSSYTKEILRFETGPEIGACGSAAHRGKRVIISDISKDSRCDPFRSALIKAGLKACWSEPIMTATQGIVGTFGMYYRNVREPDAADIEFVKTAADLAGVAIEHTLAAERLQQAYDELEERVKERTMELAETNSQLREEINERKRAEGELRQVTLAMENAVEGISRFDEEGLYVAVNKAYSDMLGSKASQMIGSKWDAMIYAADREKVQKAYEHMLNHGKSEIEARASREDESVFHAQMVMIRTLDEHKKFNGHYCFLKDITERKYTESIEIKSELLSMVAHELRTPLHAVREGVSVMLDGLTGDINDEQKDVLLTTKSSLDRLVRLVSSFLDFQRLEAGITKFNFKKIQVDVVVDEVKRLSEPLAASKELDLKIDLEKDLPDVNADQDQLIQVLTNLVHNAVKFTEKGEVMIKTALVDENVQVAVHDTGIGIKEEDIPKLFRKFGQLESGKVLAPGGTGLGLVISKRIIEQHKGKMWVESKLAKGSIFYFSLPVAQVSVNIK